MECLQCYFNTFVCVELLIKKIWFPILPGLMTWFFVIVVGNSPFGYQEITVSRPIVKRISFFLNRSLQENLVVQFSETANRSYKTCHLNLNYHFTNNLTRDMFV